MNHGLYAVLLFSPDEDRRRSVPLGVVLASNESEFISSRMSWEPHGVPAVYLPAVRATQEEFSHLFSEGAPEQVALSPEEFVHEEQHGMGNSIFLAPPVRCRFKDPTKYLNGLFDRLVDGVRLASSGG